MLLNDACHSIDSPQHRPILENIKFPNLGVAAMTQHSTAFEIERPVPAADALTDLPPATRALAAVKKFNLRKLLMAGATVAVLAGATWYGFDYWTVGRYLVSTDDAYVKADNTTVAPKVSGYLHEVLSG